MKKIEKPRIAVLGLSLPLYETAIKGFMDQLRIQLQTFTHKLSDVATVSFYELCYKQSHVVSCINRAHSNEETIDAILLIPLSYTASLMTLSSVLNTSIPIIIWNTQATLQIGNDFSSDDLNTNHAVQGTQDVTSVLIRNNKSFGMTTSHYQDKKGLLDLSQWLCAARTKQWMNSMKVGILGHSFQDMGDFAINETQMMAQWGPHILHFGIPHLLKFASSICSDTIDQTIRKDHEQYEISPEVSTSLHTESCRLEWMLRQLIEENNLDAFTMNFMDMIEDGRSPTLPFLGINKLMGEGLGYAGEGDIIHAAHMAQMRQLCGIANFTEMFTANYQSNRILMTHMQECNPALARKDRKIQLRHKKFWTPGAEPYVGMYFTLEPGPVTLSAMTIDSQGNFGYLAYETMIQDIPPLANLTMAHWFVELDEPVGDFLTRYSMAGGPHHLISVPGHQAESLRKLAWLQGFDFRKL